MPPLELLANDRRAAQLARDPWANLCVLATVDANGFPQARVLVLRDIDDRLGLFMNSTSPKCAELARTPRVAVVTYLASRSAQYRLSATVAPIDPAIVRSNWRLRPVIPKTMDWLYTIRLVQSDVVASRETLVALQTAIADELGPELVAPETAVGFYLDIDVVERLELANDRVHDRRRYTRTGDGWREEVLVP